ncbi:hypothetical protein GCM10008957_30300 [Deinococcus ruber]|uniref:Uncharacterized protein n=1 Tax=Deinococcus ruber TaxID=1848197 RepID=A0A918F8H0_9DEIO|nr:hypothetical protein GCM10008957_30300 [Deinococcus ruber]
MGSGVAAGVASAVDVAVDGKALVRVKPLAWLDSRAEDTKPYDPLGVFAVWPAVVVPELLTSSALEVVPALLTSPVGVVGAALAVLLSAVGAEGAAEACALLDTNAAGAACGVAAGG